MKLAMSATIVVLVACSVVSAVSKPRKGEHQLIGPQTDFGNMTPDQAFGLLANAQSIKIAGDNHANQTYCNGRKRPSWDIEHRAEMGCVHIGEGGYGPTPEYSLPTSMEALFRGCGIYAVSTDETWGDDRSGLSCGILGARFAALGNLDVAKAIWERAPGCRSHDRAGNPINGCMLFVLSGDPDWGVYRGDWHRDYQTQHEQAYASDPAKLLAMARLACKESLDFSSCLYLKNHGVPIDMQVVRDAESQRQQNVHVAWEESHAELAQADREKDAHFNTFMAVLSSMPGANDPNAIINAANQQGAQMVAIGATNDAARDRAAPATRGGPRSAGSSNSAINSLVGNSTPSSAGPSPTATTISSLLNSDTPAGQSSSTNTTPETCPNMQAYPDLGAGCNPVRNELSCVKVLSATWNLPTATSDGMLRVTFQNACSSTIRITAWGPAGGSNNGETTNVASGGQYVFANDREHYEYRADDGVDCFGNNARPGCASIGH